MSALPRPDVSGAAAPLYDALHDLHHRAGWPSLRTLARETGVSHTTVSKTFSGPTLPSWGTLQVLVVALGGDPAAFQGLWLAASRPIKDERADLTSAPHIAGRRAELTAVASHLEKGNGLLLVTGEAGMGKTTLVTTAAGSARSVVLVGHCLPLSTEIPLLPFAEVLRSVYEEDSGRTLRDVLRECPEYVAPSLTRLLPTLTVTSHLGVPDHQWSHEWLFAAIRTVLEVLHRKRPTALIIEDLHWADADSLDLLEQMAQTSPVRVVGSWRLHDPDVPTRRRDWLARAQRRVDCIELQPLSLEDSTMQLRLLRFDITDDQARLIHERSQGQPLFTEQLLDAPGPSSPYLDDLLDRRISPLRRHAWRVASVLGVGDRPLAEDLVRDATGIGRRQLAETLRELRDRRLLEVSGDTLHLRHPLLAEAVRRRLMPGETTDTHQRLARAMSAEPGAEPAEVAIHWQHAAEPAEELIWRIRAARAAAERFSASQAADHWLRTLSLWPAGISVAGDPPLRRHEAVAGAVNQLDLGGRVIEEAPVLEAALSAPDEFEAAERADLLRLFARVNSTQWTAAGRGLEYIDQSIALFRTLPPSSGLATALVWKSAELEWRGRREEATAAITEAVQVASLTGDVPLQRLVRARRAWQLAVSGDDGAVEEIETLQTHLPGGSDLEQDLDVAIRHTDILVMNCRSASDVDHAARREIDRAERRDLDDHRVRIVKANVALAWRRAGHLGRALQVLAGDTEVQDPGPGLLWPHIERALLDLLRGNTEAARHRLSYFRPGRHQVTDALIAEAQMHYDIWMGDPADAFRRFETLIDSRHEEISPGTVGDLLALGARAAADSAVRSSSSQRHDVIRSLLGLRARLHHDPYDPPAVRADRAAGPQWSAELARLRGQDTMEMWLAAVQRWDGLSRPHDAAYCRWRAAQCALRDGQGSIAARLLKRATVDAREHVPLSQTIVRSAAAGR